MDELMNFRARRSSDHSPDAGTRLLSAISYCNAEFYYVGIIPRPWLLGAIAAATRGFEGSKHRCRR